MILLLILSLSLGFSILYSSKLRQTIQRTPRLLNYPACDPAFDPDRDPACDSDCDPVSAPDPEPDRHSSPFSLSIVVPAYNEAENIRDCLQSILHSSDRPAAQLEVWLVDDQSTDATWSIAQTLRDETADPRLHLLAGHPRPTGETWVGKNWACTQAVEQAIDSREFLLFLDADLRLRPGALATALTAMEHEAIDLLTCAPTIVCGCLMEWLVQPLMLSIILVGFALDTVNDPKSDAAFAFGPFMLFRRTAYDRLGGHRTVAHQVVEDVELARLIKVRGLSLHCVMAPELATLRMYRSGAALWEGWTKNLFLGMQRNWSGAFQLMMIMLLVCTVPWVGLTIALCQGVWLGWTVWTMAAIGLSLALILNHYSLRQLIAQLLGIPGRYWWLTGLGGLVIAAIVVTSIVKTETGWGWTWRGRSLKGKILA